MTVLSNLFTPSTIICLGITLLLVGLLGMYFYGKFVSQDHKITSMFGLVSSMAEEMHFMREKIQTVKFGGTAAASFPFVPDNKEELVASSNSELISVSDDDSGSDSDLETDSDSGSDSDSDLETDERAVHVGGEGIGEGEGKDDIHEIKFDEAIVDNDVKIINIQEEEDHDLDSVSSSSSSSMNDIDDDEEDNESIELPNSNELLINRDMLKTISISRDGVGGSGGGDVVTVDYKKMSVNQLRNIANEKGIANSNKLKKEELLKLLG